MSEREVEGLLREAVDTFGPSAAERAAVLRGLDAPPRRRPWRSVLGGVGVAAAALLALLLLPTSVTLADVRAAFLAQDWVRLEFDDGEVRWSSPAHDVSARVAPDGYLAFIDYRTGLASSYWPNGQTIHQREVRPRALGEDAWELVVGPLRERAEGGGEGSPRWSVEREVEQVDGRELLRFDSYFVDALDERSLRSQLWADPETRLPVRVREWRDAGRRVDDEHEWVTGEYTFPAQGPRTIHDLGAPRGLEVAGVPAPEAPAEVRAILGDVLAARRAFPFAFRSAFWELTDPNAELDVLYWIGRPELQRFENGFMREHHGPCRVWDARYFDLGHRHPEYDVPRDASGAERLAWAEGQPPVSVTIWDGERELTLRPGGPDVLVDEDPPRLRVFRTGGDLYANDHNFPHDVQWPNALLGVDGSWTLVDEGPSGTLGVRHTRGASRTDYYHDPERDHLCVLMVRWDKGPAGWAPVSERRLGDLDRLPGGAWVARTVRERRALEELVYRQYVELLDPDEVDLARFDGDAHIDEAEAEGWEIEGE